MSSLRRAHLIHFAAVATMMVAAAGSLSAQWKTNPVVDLNHEIPARDLCRLELDGCPFVLVGGCDGIYADRLDRKGYSDSSLLVTDPSYTGSTGPWWKRNRMSDCAACKSGPREFFVAYNVHSNHGTLPPLPDVVRVARVAWNPITDQLDVMPGFPKTLQNGIASHIAIATSTNAGVVDGAIVAWQVTDKSAGTVNLYQQGVDLTGGLSWPGFPGGVPVDPVDLGTATGDYQAPSVVSTGDGEAIVTYHKRASGVTQHWTAKLQLSGGSVPAYRFNPRLVPGQTPGSVPKDSVTRCCVATDGSGGAVYGFASNWGDTTLLAARVHANGNGQTLTLWDSSQGGGPGGPTDHLRALSMLALPGGHALLTYRDDRPPSNSGIRCIELNAANGLAMGWTRFVRGASIQSDEVDDAASTLLGNVACIVSTSDAEVRAIAFDTSGAPQWNGNDLLVNDPNDTSLQYWPIKPRWPHVFAHPGLTAGFMVAWHDDEDVHDDIEGVMIAERFSKNGKLGKWFFSPFGWGSPHGPGTAAMFDVNLQVATRFDEFDLYFSEPLGATGVLEVYAAAGASYLGIETSSSAWTLVGSGSVVTSANGQLTNVTLSAPFVLPAGTSALLLRGNGVSLDATPAPAASLVYDVGDIVVSCGALVTNWPNGQLFANRALQGGFAYQDASVSENPGAVTTFGSGCYSRTDSVYAHFADAAAAAAVLSGQSLRFTFAGDQYVASWGGGAFVPPSLAALPLSGFLPNADDGVVAVALSSPLPYPGGVTGLIQVHSNGNIWMEDDWGWVVPNDYTPTPAALLGAGGTGFWSWHDFNAMEVGSGAITYEEIGSVAYLTWNGVESYPAGVANPSTLQFQFDLATGDVTMVWPSIDGNSQSPFGSSYLVGYSPGGDSIDGGSVDLTSLNGVPTGVGMFPLQLGATLPIVGTAMTLTADNVPEAAPGSGIHLGVMILSGTPMPGPGIDLGFLGAPGCTLGVGTFDVTMTLIGATPTLSVPFTIPPGVPIGTTIYAQAAALVVPGTFNPAGILTSNALQLRIGD